MKNIILCNLLAGFLLIPSIAFSGSREEAFRAMQKAAQNDPKTPISEQKSYALDPLNPNSLRTIGAWDGLAWTNKAKKAPDADKAQPITVTAPAAGCQGKEFTSAEDQSKGCGAK